MNQKLQDKLAKNEPRMMALMESALLLLQEAAQIDGNVADRDPPVNYGAVIIMVPFTERGSHLSDAIALSGIHCDTAEKWDALFRRAYQVLDWQQRVTKEPNSIFEV